MSLRKIICATNSKLGPFKCEALWHPKATATLCCMAYWVLSFHNIWQQKPVNATIPFSPDLVCKGRDPPSHYYEAVCNNSELVQHPL